MALGWDGAITIVVLSLGLIVMMADWLAPHLTFTLMVGVLMAATVIDTKAGASGFSNTGVLTVVVLYAVAEGVSQTGGLDRLMSRVLGTSATSARAALIRMMLPVAIASAFLNNTPIVALMIPILISWGRRCNVSPKVLLLPLSYASIFGGTTTLIGTSTNLVISGLQAKRYAGTPDANFSFFSITPYGLPYGVWGFVYVLLIGIFLLPKDTGSRPKEDLLLAAEVGPAATQIAGKTLDDSGLLSLSGLRLFSILRGGTVIYKAPQEVKAKRRFPFSKAPKANPKDDAAAGTHRAATHGSTALPPGPQLSPSSSMVVVIGSDPEPGHITLQAGDVLQFHGNLKQLQEHAERLGLVIVTSSQQPLQDVLHAAARGRPTLGSTPAGSRAASAAATRAAGEEDTFRGTKDVLSTLKPLVHGSTVGGSSMVSRRASVGWSGSTMWLLRAVVKKNASVVGQSLDGVDWWGRFGVIVIGAELKDKRDTTASLGQLVLQPGDLLVFTARNDLDFRAANFVDNFDKLDFMRDQKPKDFLLALRVRGGRSGAAGKDIATNGLQDIAGLFITAITRPKTQETFTEINPHLVLEADDILWFLTDLEGVKYLLRDLRLEAVEAKDAAKLKARQIHRHLVQATVSPDSALIGHTPRQLRFRTYFESTVIAIHRESGQVDLKSAADVRLNAGDVLLVEADTGFRKRFSTNPAFGLVADVPGSAPLKTKLMWPAVALAAAMVLTQIIAGFTGKSYIDLWPAAILTAAAMLAIGCMNSDQAIAAIDWPVYITIAFAFGVSAAMEKSYVAQSIASLFVTISKAIGGKTAALGSMYLVTGLLSEVLTNNAAAALMYPIAANVGDDMGIEPKMMSIAVMLGASAAFISPFGYQCNLMVFSAGQYRTIDFVKIGTLLQLWQLVGACVILSMPNHWMILCAIALVIVVLAVIYAVIVSLLLKRKAKKVKEAALAQQLATLEG